MADEFLPLNIAILTVSDTRTEATDTSGDILKMLAAEAGHHIVVKKIVRDDKNLIVQCLSDWIGDAQIDIVITTGGTGVTGRDVTPEALDTVCEKKIPGFGEMFRFLSYEKIGASAIQSRADAGTAKGTYLFALPGSISACRDGWDFILKSQLDSRTKPCNFAKLIKRLEEK